MSAASFLGISAAVMISGYDGLIYSIGFLVGWPILTFLMAERLRNLGKFTFADVAAFRFAQTPVRIFAASGTLVVVAFYLIAQMVGAGQLIKLLFGLDYWIAVVIVGALMMVYVLFGGMTATTWVQIIKACLLLAGASFMALHGDVALRLQPRGACSPTRCEVKTELADRRGQDTGGSRCSRARRSWARAASSRTRSRRSRFGMALMFGTAGLPHILMRFFTVPSAKEARKSVMWATGWIGYFYLLTFIIGFGAITFVLTNPDFLDAERRADRRQQHGGRPSRRARSGGNVFLGFISAVAFATILAVVAGLTLSGASAVSHDLYATVVKKGKADSAAELRVSRITTICLGIARGDARHRLREAEHRLHGVAGLRGRGVRQLPGAVHVGPLEGLHHQGRRRRRLPRADLVGGADGAVAVGLGSDARQPGRLGAVPLHLAGALLDDARLRRHLARLEDGQQPAGADRPGRLRRPAGALGDRHRRLGGLGALTLP